MFLQQGLEECIVDGFPLQRLILSPLDLTMLRVLTKDVNRLRSAFAASADTYNYNTIVRFTKIAYDYTPQGQTQAMLALSTWDTSHPLVAYFASAECPQLLEQQLAMAHTLTQEFHRNKGNFCFPQCLMAAMNSPTFADRRVIRTRDAATAAWFVDKWCSIGRVEWGPNQYAENVMLAFLLRVKCVDCPIREFAVRLRFLNDTEWARYVRAEFKPNRFLRYHDRSARIVNDKDIILFSAEWFMIWPLMNAFVERIASAYSWTICAIQKEVLLDRQVQRLWIEQGNASSKPHRGRTRSTSKDLFADFYRDCADQNRVPEYVLIMMRKHISPRFAFGPIVLERLMFVHINRTEEEDTYRPNLAFYCMPKGSKDPVAIFPGDE